MRPVLLVPGIYNSGPRHWQSLWEAKHPGVSRVEQADWNYPVCDEWVRVIDAAIARADAPPVLVAHSLGCLAVARWSCGSMRPVHALVLVAVPDPQGPNFPTDARGFAPVPRALAPAGHALRSVTLVSSSNDPYSSAEFADRCTADWSARRIALGAHGHLNADSHLADWPEAWEWVLRLRG